MLFTAFCVVLGTLVLQGLTVRPLMRVCDWRTTARWTGRCACARVETLRAALAVLNRPRTTPSADLLRRRYELMLARAEAERAADDDAAPRLPTPVRASAAEAAIMRATAAERQRLIALRADATIGDAAFQQIEQELDLEGCTFGPARARRRFGVSGARDGEGS